MNYSVADLVKITGITRRTLHYYDKIGLLSPQRNPDNDYRFYGQEDLLRLQEILFLKAVGLSLAEIKDFLERGRSEQQELLKGYQVRLKDKIAYLQKLACGVENYLDGQPILELDLELTRPLKEQYQSEAEYRFGQTAAFQSFKKKQENLSLEEKDQQGQDIERELSAIFERLYQQRHLPVSADSIQAEIAQWRTSLAKVMEVDQAVLQGIALSYQKDARFHDYFDRKYGAGFADYLSQAIYFYLDTH
ncbi:MerR family transcriptional regulator [Streptococcus oricebi]|uniref:MerR family transcriptional regulator n=1 Tax=Streptococcus oricebi TaxID=1547447 RepID=A0ABS5B5J2_9STRE|nr:MerR family transcriptional regulator [Streptococcus oricebi]MBP2623718.1 MerR family transcriptional regulator [Streptococcus oricebi]